MDIGVDAHYVPRSLILFIGFIVRYISTSESMNRWRSPDIGALPSSRNYLEIYAPLDTWSSLSRGAATDRCRSSSKHTDA